MPPRIEERQVLVRSVLQLVTLVAVLNGESSWRPHWDRLLPDIGPPRWTRRSPFRRFFFIGVPRPANFVRRALREQLLEFVEAWRNAGERFRDFWEWNPSLAERLRIACQNCRLELMLGPDGEPVMGPVSPAQGMEFGIFLACWEFMDFAQNPFRDRLGKCSGCKRYYVAIKRFPKKAFCSALCRSSGSHRPSMRRKYEEAQRVKMERVQNALALLVSGQDPVSNWKAWVANHAGVTKNWITIAVKEGKLNPPSRQGREG
jgi:hypothetical protein